ncbi:hypothetical protein P856_69 [Candidatus Endolissoclinum faulkneri L5]|uniref:Uncharacterized protein n=1 Tax=Candidatus Endolissoclinum faulkneri L5 TaxID=1401328 RepID=V9TRX7_9PROT|nr:hypothetical protein P856_69 [Candidatus Endolissoclinum faulkneri L5]
MARLVSIITTISPNYNIAVIIRRYCYTTIIYRFLFIHKPSTINSLLINNQYCRNNIITMNASTLATSSGKALCSCSINIA